MVFLEGDVQFVVFFVQTKFHHVLKRIGWFQILTVGNLFFVWSRGVFHLYPIGCRHIQPFEPPPNHGGIRWFLRPQNPQGSSDEQESFRLGAGRATAVECGDWAKFLVVGFV